MHVEAIDVYFLPWWQPHEVIWPPIVACEVEEYLAICETNFVNMSRLKLRNLSAFAREEK